MKERIKKNLQGREKKSIPEPGLVSSAVLIPVYEKAGEYYILFTRRTEKVPHHKGQISFPGGRKDEGDNNLLATALRESFEEIGLRPEAVEILGELDDECTIFTNFVVSPFVGIIPCPYDFEINQGEVEELIEAPLAALADKTTLLEKIVTDSGRIVKACSYHYKDQVIWGATARILKQFLDLIYADENSLNGGSEEA